jgi:hypothetical protein
MNRRYPHRIRITRSAGGGGRDPATGAWVTGGEQTVYDGAADVQDSPEVLSRDVGGAPLLMADARTFLPASRQRLAEVVQNIRDGDHFEWVTPIQRDGEVVQVRLLDGSFGVRFL